MFAWTLFNKQKVSARNLLSDMGLIAKFRSNSVWPKNFLPNTKSSKNFWLHCSRVAPLFAPMITRDWTWTNIHYCIRFHVPYGTGIQQASLHPGSGLFCDWPKALTSGQLLSMETNKFSSNDCSLLYLVTSMTCLIVNLSCLTGSL